MELLTEPFDKTLYAEELRIMLYHIFILCKKENLVYNYFIGWIAMMIQFPAIKITLITLISKEGAGKGTLMDLFRFSRMAGLFGLRPF